MASLCGSPCTLLLLSGFCRDQEKSLDKDILKGTMPGTRLATCSISVVMTVVPPCGLGQSHVTHFYILGLRSSLEWMRLDILNSVCRLNVNSSIIMHVKIPQYRVHSGSRDLLIFWEISANISLMVQNRYAMED